MSLDPKSLEFSIKVSLLSYPSLYQMRQQVINHYYCVLGNGYDWWDGRLDERCDDEKIGPVEQMLLEGRPEEEICAWVTAKDKERFAPQEKELLEFLKKHGIEFPPPLMFHPLRIYPVCDLCKIMKLPDQIRPDWLDGAEEAARLMETTQSYDEKGTEENRRLVPIIRERIAVLKANQRPQSGGGMGSMMMAV